MTKREWKLLYTERIRLGTCYCYLCNKPITKYKDLTLDHKIPVSRNPNLRNSPSNWGAVHDLCNARKGALTYEEYLLWLSLEKKRCGNVK